MSFNRRYKPIGAKTELGDLSSAGASTGDQLYFDGTDWTLKGSGLYADEDATITANWTFSSYIDLTPGTAPTHEEGRVFYDSGERALAYYNDQSDDKILLGRQTRVRVRNNSGSTITKGQVVRITGSQGANLPTVGLAQADDPATAEVAGGALHDIPNNSNGYIITDGVITGVDTSMYSAGDKLYLSTTTAGGTQNTEPTGDDIVVPLGIVTIANPSVGEVLVARLNIGVSGDISSVTGTDITNWDTAYGWGDHAAAGYLTAAGNETITGDWNFTNRLLAPEDADFRWGIHGNYSAYASTNYASQIWAIDESWNGGESGSGWSSAGTYGVSWIRSTHTDADSDVGEGFYVHVGGTQYAAFGSAASKVNTRLWIGSRGYLEQSNQTYGTMELVGDNNGYTGLGLDSGSGAVFNFMNNGTTCGIYNDTENEWALNWVRNGTTRLYYNGTVALQTENGSSDGKSTWASVRHNSGSYYEIGLNVMPRFLTNTNVTLAHQHAGGYYYHNNSTVYTITLNNTSGQGASFPIGGMLFVINYGSGNLTVNTGSGTLYVPQLGTATTGSRTIGGNSVATILKYAANTWFLWGDNVS